MQIRRQTQSEATTTTEILAGGVCDPRQNSDRFGFVVASDCVCLRICILFFYFVKKKFTYRYRTKPTLM